MSEQPETPADDTHADSTHGADDLLPHDLVPGEDNPLAEGLPDGETAGDLRHDGKHADAPTDSAERAAEGDEGAEAP